MAPKPAGIGISKHHQPKMHTVFFAFPGLMIKSQAGACPEHEHPPKKHSATFIAGGTCQRRLHTPGWFHRPPLQPARNEFSLERAKSSACHSFQRWPHLKPGGRPEQVGQLLTADTRLRLRFCYRGSREAQSTRRLLGSEHAKAKLDLFGCPLVFPEESRNQKTRSVSQRTPSEAHPSKRLPERAPSSG